MESRLTGNRVLVTGVGYKPVGFVFHDVTTGRPSHTPLAIDGIEYKANIGAATALECVKAGAAVHLIARTQEKLEQIAQWILGAVPTATITSSAIDLNDREAVRRIVSEIPDDLPLHWVQSVGLGAGTVQLKDENPYLTIDGLSDDLIAAELSVLQNTVALLQILLPRFRKQKETRICIISSMSAVRSVVSGSIHNAAKGAISRFTNAAMIELNPERIYLTDVRPGATDTGLYDSEIVRTTIERMAQSYGTDWSAQNGGPRLAPPSAVGKLIVDALSSEAHVTSINLVARGQWPHEGS